MASAGLVVLALALLIVAGRVFVRTNLHHVKRHLRYQLRKAAAVFAVAVVITALVLGWIGLHGLGVLS